MKEQNKINQLDSKQGDPKSNQQHAKNQPGALRHQSQGNTNSGGQAAHETSNSRTGGDRGNKK